MTSPHQKPGVAFWATVVIVFLVSYVASVGPAQYIAAHRLLPVGAISAGQVFYAPLASLPEPVALWLERYADWFAHAIP